MWCGFPAEQSRYRCCRPDHHDSAHEYRMAGKLVWVADGTPGKSTGRQRSQHTRASRLSLCSSVQPCASDGVQSSAAVHMHAVRSLVQGSPHALQFPPRPAMCEVAMVCLVLMRCRRPSARTHHDTYPGPMASSPATNGATRHSPSPCSIPNPQPTLPSSLPGPCNIPATTWA